MPGHGRVSAFAENLSSGREHVWAQMDVPDASGTGDDVLSEVERGVVADRTFLEKTATERVDEVEAAAVVDSVFDETPMPIVD